MKIHNLIITLAFVVLGAVTTLSAQNVVVIGGKKYIIHNVLRGQTLYSLSRQYGVTINDLIKENPALVDGLKAGQRLKVPYKAQPAKVAQTPEPQTQQQPQAQSAPAPTAEQTPAPKVEQAPAPTAEQAPAPTAEQTPAPKVEQAPAPKVVEEAPVAVETPKEEPKTETKAEPKEKPKAEPKEKPKAEPKEEMKAAPQETEHSKKETKKESKKEAKREQTAAQAEEPKTEQPKTEEPKVEQPKTEEPKVEQPKTEEVKTDTVQVEEAPTLYQRERFRRLQAGEVADVALMLPLGTQDDPKRQFVDFYRGFLVGLDSVRTKGYAVNLHLYNTTHDHGRVVELIGAGVVSDVDMVVGPIYEDELIPMTIALKGKGIPVVSPLATTKHTDGNAVFQMSPSPETKYSKVRAMLEDSRVVVIFTDNVDSRFAAEVRTLLQGVPNVIRHKFVYEHPSVTAKKARERAKAGVRAPGDMTSYLQGTKPTVFIVTAGNELDVNNILSAISSARRSFQVRSKQHAPYTVLGTNNWTKYVNIDREKYFSNNVMMVTSYHTRRSEWKLRRFDRNFAREFGSLPSRYAYRGYDAAVIFVKALFESIDTGLTNQTLTPLLTPYEFVIDPETGVRINSRWANVKYNDNFTITND